MLSLPPWEEFSSFIISASRLGQEANTVGVGACVSVGAAIGVNVIVGEGGGEDVGVSGMINLVAARQAKVESKSAMIQRNRIGDLFVSMKIGQSVLPEPYGIYDFGS